MSGYAQPEGLNVREAVERWEVWLGARRAPGTLRTYKQLAKPLVGQYGDRAIASLTVDDIEFGFLAQYAGKADATKRNYYIALKSLFDLAERHDWVLKNPLKRIEAPQRHEDFKGYLSAEDDEAVQGACMTAQESAIVMLLRHTGLRVAEAARLTWEDVDLGGGRFLSNGYPALVVRESKTDNGKRTIPLPDVLIKTLRFWRQTQTGPYVIGSRKGTVPIRPQLVHRLVVRVGDRVGVKISPHSLRWQYGSAALNNGVPLHVVSRALGHANTTVTERSYARLSNDNIAAQMMAVVR